MSDKFPEEMTSLIKDAKTSGNYSPSALRFLEEVATTPPSELGKSIDAMNGALKKAGLPTAYVTLDAEAHLKEVRLDNGYVFDTPLYLRPRLHQPSLKDPKLNALSEHFEAVKELQRDGYRARFNRAHMIQAGEFLRDEALKLSPEDRTKVLKRASAESYSYSSHALNIVFADLDGDGKASELSDMAIVYRIPDQTERIDIFDPPKH